MSSTETASGSEWDQGSMRRNGSGDAFTDYCTRLSKSESLSRSLPLAVL
jgi:hypothetical protein